MKNLALSLVLLSSLIACDNSSTSFEPKNTASKGNSKFQDLMGQGAGRFRPKAIKSGSTLGLSSNAIHSINVDDASGSWAWVGFDTALSESVRADQDFLKAAETFVGKYEVELGFSPGEILAHDGAVQQPYAGTKLVTLQRQYQGTVVKGAYVNFFFAEQSDGSFRLSEIVNKSYGALKLPSELSAMPSDADAIEATGVSDLQVVAKRPVIQPVLNKEGRYEFSYASEFELKDKESGEIVTLTLDNANREIHEAFSNRVNEVNQINAETYDRSYVLKDLISRPFQFARIKEGNKNLETDEKGNVDTNGKQVTVVLENVKNKSRVFDASDERNAVSFQTTLDPSGKTNLKLGVTDIAAINVFVAVQETINFVSKHLSTKELKIIENGFDSIVNIKEACNAYYEKQTLNFFSASARCANTGLISDVVKHEWGHGLDDFTGPNSKGTNGFSGIQDSAYSEGIGDILSSYLARSPNLAPGFNLNSPSPLRTIQNTRTHPPANAAEAEVHSAGLIIGGAFWDLHQNLTGLYGPDKGNELASRLFLRHLLTSDNYLDAYKAVLRVDDDDNNTATKSPNYCNITRAFAKHKVTGGEGAAADCLDTDTSIRIKIDFDQGNGLLSTLASAHGAAKIIACPGKVTGCKADATGYVEFTGAVGDDVLTAKGQRKFYTAKGTLDAKTNPTYSFFSLDDKGALLAKRSLDFKSDAAAPAPVVVPPTQ